MRTHREAGAIARRDAFLGGLGGLLMAAGLLYPCFPAGIPGRGDLPDFFWPMKAYTAARWAADGVPLWNPLSGCGEPWLAQLQSGVLYPLDAVFLLPWPFGPLACVALHLALAAAGMSGWLARLGASRPAALAGGLLFAAGGPFVSLFPVLNNACTAAWLPWLFWAAAGVVAGRGLAGFAVVVSLAFLAGEPSLAAAGAAAAVAVAWFTRGEDNPLRARPGPGAAGRLAAGLLLGLGLAAATLLPFGELLLRSGRIGGATRPEALARPVGVSDLADLALPPREEATRSVVPGRGGYLVSLALGPAVFLLAAGAWAGFPGRRRLLGSMAALGGAGLLLSLGAGGGLVPALWDSGLVTGLRFPARWFVFTHLFLALAAAAGLDGWIWGSLRREAPREDVTGALRASGSPRAIWIGAGLFVGLLSLLLLVTALRPDVEASRDARRGLVVALAAAGVVVACAAGRLAGILRREAGWAAALAVVLPLPFVAGDPLSPIPAASVLVRSSALKGLEDSVHRVFVPAADGKLLTEWLYRGIGVWTPEVARRGVEILAGYTNLFSGTKVVHSASPIPDPRRERLVGAALAGGDPATLLGLVNARTLLAPMPARIPRAVPEGRFGDLHRYRLPSPAGRVFLARSSREATDDEVFEAVRRPGFDPEEVALLAPDPVGGPLPPARTGRSFGVVRLIRDEPEVTEIATSTSFAQQLVLTRSFDPGWQATLDGEPVRLRRAFLALTAVMVPAGDHRILLEYVPRPWKTGALVSALSLLVCAGLALAGQRPPV